MLKVAPTSFSEFAQKPVPYGLYSGLIGDMNSAHLSSLRRSQRKVWVYAGAFTKDYYVGFAIADAGIVATAFAYVFDVVANKYIEEKITVPLGFPSAFDPDLKTNWKLKNFSITTHDNNIKCSYTGNRLKLTLQIADDGKGATTLAPAAGRPFHHTYKNLLLPTTVALTVDGKAVELTGNIGGIDFSKGYPPRQTFWNWASLNGVTESGISFGANLVGDFNNSIENALYVNGSVSQLSQATFSYGKPVDKSVWHIKILDGTIDMEFKPLGVRGENINAFIMMSIFKQPFGVFTGTILLNGQSHKFTAYGVVEEHFAKW